ncbi:MAG: hypothetical protein WBQ86_11055 [Candidatus Binatus sp.]
MKDKSAVFRYATSASLSGSALRVMLRIYRRYFRLPVETEVALNWAARPSYAYCTYHAADLARRLGIPRISVIEFGVAGGNGLLFLKDFAARVQQAVGIEVEVYGFDTGAGLPEVTALEDLPYWFHTSLYRMDEAALQAKLHPAKLVLGDVADTVSEFFTRHNPAPVGAIFNDLTLYSSTRDSLRLLEQDVSRFLPRLFMYFDDVIGTEIEMYSECNGQLLAISEFNRRQQAVYVGLNQNLLARSDIGYRYQIYYAHLRSHPLYRQHIAGEEQKGMEAALRLSE